MGAQQGTEARAAAAAVQPQLPHTQPQSPPPRSAGARPLQPPAQTAAARHASPLVPPLQQRDPQALRDAARDSERVLVGVRVRPLTDQERSAGQSWLCASAKGNRLTVQRDERGVGMRSFVFDRVWWSIPGGAQFHGQRDVYDDIGKLMLENAFSGYNTCIFAYGQTSSGKTYTMMGDEMGDDDSRGIIPRACRDLFARIDATPRPAAASGGSDERIQSYQVSGSYYEIYNEKVYDLIDASRAPGQEAHGLRVREHPISGPYVEGLRQETVALYDEVLLLMQQGNRHRHTNQTRLNDRSSRSHAIFTLTLKQTLYKDGELIEYLSRINLVDLAGSERTKAAGTSGDAFQEGININKSLANLGQVIHYLADRDEHGKDFYINFRDSQLTWLLRENLGGNSKTIMVATVSPAARCIDETLNTLRYADRVKQIKQKATVNEDSTTKLIRDLRHEVAQLRKENMELSRLRHELDLTRRTLRDAESRVEAVQRADPLTGDLINLSDDSPYFVLLRPNPQMSKPVLLRLSYTVTLLTEPGDSGALPADLPTDAGRLCVPAMPRRAAAVRRVSKRGGAAGNSVFGNRRCELQPLQSECRLLLPPRAASVTAPRGSIQLSHGCVVGVGDIVLRFADPCADDAVDDPVSAICDGKMQLMEVASGGASAQQGIAAGSGQADLQAQQNSASRGAASATFAPISDGLAVLRPIASPGVSTQQRPHASPGGAASAPHPAPVPPEAARGCGNGVAVATSPISQPAGGGEGHRPSLGHSEELRAALAAAAAAAPSPAPAPTRGGSAPRQASTGSTPASPAPGSSGSPREQPQEDAGVSLQRASALLKQLGASAPKDSAEAEQLLSLAASLNLAHQKKREDDAELALLQQQLSDGQGLLDQMRAEHLQETQLLQLKVMEATKEAEAKDAVVEDQRRESHRQREAAERMMQELQADARRASEEAAQEHARRLADAEEALRNAHIERDQLQELHESALAEMAESLGDAQARASALAIVLRDTETAVAQQQERKEQAEQALDQVRQSYDKLIGDVGSLRVQLDQVMRQKEMTEAEKAALEARMQAVETQHRQRLSQLDADFRDARRRLEEREAELAAVRARERELEEKLRSTEREAAAELRQKQLELQHLQRLAEQKELAAMTAEALCDELRERAEGAQEELRGLQTELDQRREEVAKKERVLSELHSERAALRQAHQRELRETEEQARQRERNFAEQSRQIADLHQEINSLQQKATTIQERNRELFQRENQTRERKQRLAVELEVKERELKDTKVKYTECYQRLQMTIKKGQKETKQGEQLRRLTQIVKEAEARIAFLEKELQDSQAHARRLEETRAVQHTQEQVQRAKDDMVDVMAMLKAEVIEFSPPALRQVSQIANSVQHAADPRRIFRQAFNHIRLVIKELSGREQIAKDPPYEWDIEEQHFGHIKPFQKSAALKAMREIVIWHGLSPDFARQHYNAYTELSTNRRWLQLLARICQSPNTFGDVSAIRIGTPETPMDASLRPLILAARRHPSAARGRAGSVMSQQDETATAVAAAVDAMMSQSMPLPGRPGMVGAVPPPQLDRAAPQAGTSVKQVADLIAPRADPRADTAPTQSRPGAPAGPSSRPVPRQPGGGATSGSRSRSPGIQAAAAMAGSSAMRSITADAAAIAATYDDDDDEAARRRRPDPDPSKSKYMQPTMSSQSKENADRHPYPLAAHMARSARGRAVPQRASTTAAKGH